MGGSSPAQNEGATTPPPAGEGRPRTRTGRRAAARSRARRSRSRAVSLSPAMALAIGGTGVPAARLATRALAARWRGRHRLHRPLGAVSRGGRGRSCSAQRCSESRRHLRTGDRARGATAAGISFWPARSIPTCSRVVSETRVVQAWAIPTPGRVAGRRWRSWSRSTAAEPHAGAAVKCALGADGTALGSGPSRAQSLALLGAVAQSAHHRAVGRPRHLAFPARAACCLDTIHVLSTCPARRPCRRRRSPCRLRLAGPQLKERTPLLAIVVGRLSRPGFLLEISPAAAERDPHGVLVASFDALVDTTYGRLAVWRRSHSSARCSGWAPSISDSSTRCNCGRSRPAAPRQAPPRRRCVEQTPTPGWLRHDPALGVTSVLVATQPAVTGAQEARTEQ